MKAKKEDQIAFAVEKDFKDSLQKLSDKKDIPISQICREAIKQYLINEGALKEKDHEHE